MFGFLCALPAACLSLWLFLALRQFLLWRGAAFYNSERSGQEISRAFFFPGHYAFLFLSANIAAASRTERRITPPAPPPPFPFETGATVPQELPQELPLSSLAEGVSVGAALGFSEGLSVGAILGFPVG